VPLAPPTRYLPVTNLVPLTPLIRNLLPLTLLTLPTLVGNLVPLVPPTNQLYKLQPPYLLYFIGTNRYSFSSLSRPLLISYDLGYSNKPGYLSRNIIP
jgi:hypothetical protein